MSPFLKSSLAACAMTLAASSAHAATANVPFTSLVLATCVLTVGTPGIMAPNALYNELDSSAAGGVPGTISALSTGTTFKVSAIAPTSFLLSPTDGNTSVAFASTYQASGATTTGTVPGVTQTTLNSGLTTLNVNLKATRSAGNFPAGAYTAEVVVRCE